MKALLTHKHPKFIMLLFGPLKHMPPMLHSQLPRWGGTPSASGPRLSTVPCAAQPRAEYELSIN